MVEKLPPLGETVAARRRTLGLTQATLAERVGVNESTIRNWETRGTQPARRNYPPLASALKLPLEDLLERPPGPVVVRLDGTRPAAGPDLVIRFDDEHLIVADVRVLSWDMQPADVADSAAVLAAFTDALELVADQHGWKIRLRRHR